MTLKELVTGVAAETGLTKKVTQEAIKLAFSEIAKGISAGDRIMINGFGTFKSNHVNPQKRQNLQNKKYYIYPEKNVPKFKAHKSFEIELQKGERRSS